ncbi:MAG: hypothetical protein IPO81_09720 [Kouleothrix sp.]|nr:hypothetical protein [Kouleothrix sp.]
MTHTMRPPKLADLFAHLRWRAVDTGQPQTLTLRGGARIAVWLHDGLLRFSVARREVEVGEREERTFKQICGVPAGATRVPATGQKQRAVDGATWYQVGWIWPDVDDAGQDRRSAGPA